jgi:fructose transport system substrate-binding protein
MSRRLRRVPVLVSAATVLLVAAACGGDTGDDAADDPADDTGDDTAADEAADGGDVLVGLITKTDTNPFFVRMAEGAQQKADELGVELQTFAGTRDGDNESQVEAIETLIAAGAAGILITPSDSAAIVPSIEAARDAGILVIALDTPTDPADAVDATFATDNFLAGEYIGQWAAGTLGEAAADARIALLDLNADQVTVDVARNQGFLQGFGIDLGDPDVIGDEDDPRIVGNDTTDGSVEGGLAAMERLLATDPDVSLVYTINEPAAEGARTALENAGVADDVLIVSVDGGCPGVEAIADGNLGATSMQFPLDMASLGVQAVYDFATAGAQPEVDPDLGFFDTGVTLITDEPVDGLESEDSAWGLDNCWG